MVAVSTKFTQCHIILHGSYSRWLIFQRQWPNSVKGPTQTDLLRTLLMIFPLSVEIRWFYWNLYLARWDTCFGQKTGQCSSQFLLDQDMCVHRRHTMPIGWDGSKCCRFFRTAISPRIYVLLLTRVYPWSHSSLLFVAMQFLVCSEPSQAGQNFIWWCCEIPIGTYMRDS